MATGPVERVRVVWRCRTWWPGWSRFCGRGTRTGRWAVPRGEPSHSAATLPECGRPYVARGRRVRLPPSADPRGGLRIAAEIGSRRGAPTAGAWSTHRDIAGARVSWQACPPGTHRAAHRPRALLCGSAWRVDAKQLGPLQGTPGWCARSPVRRPRWSRHDGSDKRALFLGAAQCRLAPSQGARG